MTGIQDYVTAVVKNQSGWDAILDRGIEI